VIKAHARLYHFYHEDLEGTGKLGIKFNDNFGIPKDPKNASHVDATNHFNDFQVRAYNYDLKTREPDAMTLISLIAGHFRKSHIPGT